MLRRAGLDYLHDHLQPEDSIRPKPGNQPLPLAQELERLQQVQGLPIGVCKQEVAERGERRLRPLRRRCPWCCWGGPSRAMLTPLLAPRPLRSLADDGLEHLARLSLSERLPHYLPAPPDTPPRRQ